MDKIDGILKKIETPEPGDGFEKRIIRSVERRRRRKLVYFYIPAFSCVSIFIAFLIFHFLIFAPMSTNNKIKFTRIIETPPKNNVSPEKKVVFGNKKKAKHTSYKKNIIEDIKIVFPSDGDYLTSLSSIVITGEETGKLSITIDDTTFVVDYKPINGFMEIKNKYLDKLSDGTHYLKITLGNVKEEIMFNKVMEVARR